jgi:DNA-binding NarL/FixJ family response regulator
MTDIKMSDGKKLVKILIVDDHPIVREGLAARIARQADLVVCGEAEDVADALELVKATQPDLVIVDLSLKSGQGIDLIKKIKARAEDTKMLVSSMYDESLYAERALRAGALGYINKQEMSDKILEAIRQVMDGKIYLSPPMTERLLQRAVGSTPQLIQSPIENLSDRELEIFKMIGTGKTTRQIAGELHLSVKTVETHRENIKAKLDIPNSAELSREAVQWVMENGA